MSANPQQDKKSPEPKKKLEGPVAVPEPEPAASASASSKTSSTDKDVGVYCATDGKPEFPIDGIRPDEILPPGMDRSDPDVTSMMERFTWETFPGEKSVPLLKRGDKHFVAIRMAVISVLEGFFRVVPKGVIKSLKPFPSYRVMPAEAGLLNAINTFHCDGFYGEEFSLDDLLITLQDLQVFHNFLKFAHDVIVSKGDDVRGEVENSGFVKNCGFLKGQRGRGGKIVYFPFTVLESGEHGVPTKIFQWQHQDRAPKIITLEQGWPIAYLKVCILSIMARQPPQPTLEQMISSPTIDVYTLRAVHWDLGVGNLNQTVRWGKAGKHHILSEADRKRILSGVEYGITDSDWSKVEDDVVNEPVV